MKVNVMEGKLIKEKIKEENIIIQILSIVENCINNTIVENKLSNPEEITVVKTERIALSIGILSMLKFRDSLNVDLPEANFKKNMEYFTSKYSWSKVLLNYYLDLNSYEKELVESWYQDLTKSGFNELSLSSVYENLLSYNWVIKNGKFHVVINKASRNRSGSYYTPEILADMSVRKTIDELIEYNLQIQEFSFNNENYINDVASIVEFITEIKVIDLSSGTGHFLKSVVKYVQEYILPIQSDSMFDQVEVLDQVIHNIWGIDIDFIALQIAQYELALITGTLESMNILNRHFHQGNPLLPFNNEKRISEEERRRLTSEGFIYHKELGLTSKVLNEQINEGFDLIVGNPPWEKIRFEEKSFFSSWAPNISILNKKDERLKEIDNLEEINPPLYVYYKRFIESLDSTKRMIEVNPLLVNSVAGELNTYALFTELATRLLSNKGRVCYVVKSGLVVSPVNAKLFKFLLDKQIISHCYDFINKKNIFAIDSRERFCIIILGQHSEDNFYFRSGLLEPEELFLENDLAINKSILELMNPLTGMLPSISNENELAFLIKMYSENQLFDEVFSPSKFGRLVHFTNHAQYIHRKPDDRVVPIYEGKFIEIYDGKYSTYEGLSEEEKYGSKSNAIAIPEEKKQDPHYIPESRYFIEKRKWEDLSKNYKSGYSLMWRSLTSASNRRTCIASILPHMPASQSVQFLQLEDNKSLALLLSLYNSIVFDYMVRLKLNGIDLTQKIIKQIAVPSMDRYEKYLNFQEVEAKLSDHILARVGILLQDDVRLVSFCNDIYPEGYSRITDLEKLPRKQVIAELDILISKLYNIDNETLSVIIDSFPKFYTSDEKNKYFKL